MGGGKAWLPMGGQEKPSMHRQNKLKLKLKLLLLARSDCIEDAAQECSETHEQSGAALLGGCYLFQNSRVGRADVRHEHLGDP